MNKYTNFIYKNKKILGLFFLIINVIAVIGIFKIKLNTDFSMFSQNESVYEERLDELENIFGELNQLVVVVEVENINHTSLTNIRYIQSKLEQLENIEFVQGMAPVNLFINGTEVPFEDLSTDTIMNYYRNFKDFSPIKVKNNTNYITYTIFINDNFSKDGIRSIENILGEFNYQSYISGDSYNQLKVSDYIIKILLILPPLALLVILLVFRWQMGAIKPTLMSVLPAGIGSLWTFGIIGWLSNEISILTAIVPIFIIVIGSADGLHFMSHFQDLTTEGFDNKTSLNETLRIVGKPMIVTTLTSLAGFMSLLSMNTESIKDLAIYSTVGIALAGIATWYVLPLLLSHNIAVLRKNKHITTFDPSIFVKKLWGIPCLVIIIIIVTISAFTYKNINNEFNMLMVYKKNTVVSINSEKISEVNGGSIPIFVTISLEESPTSMASLNKVNALATKLNSIDEVNKVVNPYELLNIIYNINAVGDIPNEIVLKTIYNNISKDENSTINDLLAIDNNIARLLVFSKDLNNETLDIIERTVNDNSSNASVTGVQYLMKDLNVNISEMQLKSIFIALFIVLVLLIITLRSFKIALVSLLPIIITIISLYGFLGITSIPLNITTVIIFSITIGVGIDYAVHFSSVYKYYLAENYDNHLAIEKAYKNTSRPIITNALGISLGLSILMLSPLTIHFNVSVLMWISMTISVLITLTLLPFIFSKNRNRK